MSWKGTLARTERNGDLLNIIIHYTDELDREYDQTLSISNMQTDTWLQDQINNKINQLNDLDSFENTLNQTTPKDTVFEVEVK